MRGSSTLSLGVLIITLAVVPGFAGTPISDPVMRSALEDAAPSGWPLSWDTPAHLFEDFTFSPALEASVARYSRPSGEAGAVALIIKTAATSENPRGLYPHDYRVCASLHSGILISVNPTSIAGGSFQMLHVSKSSISEHATNFIVRDHGSTFEVDSEVLSDLYPPAVTEEVYNIQVWAEDPQTTTQIVADLLASLAASKSLIFSNSVEKVAPTVIVNSVQFEEDEVLLRLNLQAPALVRADVVATAYPNPNPALASVSEGFEAGTQRLRIPIDSILSGATDAEIYLFESDVLVDKVLASFNAYGDAASSWFPFSGGGGFVSVVRGEGSPDSNGGSNDILLNGHHARLSGDVGGANGFVGAFVEVIPESEEPADLRDMVSLSLLAKTPATLTGRSFELKLETSDSSQYRVEFVPDAGWQRLEFPFVSFQGPAGPVDWANVGDDVRRIAIATVHDPGRSSQIDLEIAELAVQREPVPVPEVGVTLGLVVGCGLIVLLFRWRASFPARG